MDVSVIIVSYNTRQLLLESLRSLYASVGVRDIEVVVVDNASSDGSADAARAAFPQCSVIPLEENVGFSRANNLAIQRARARYLLAV